MKNGLLITAPAGARNRREHLFREIVSRHTGNDYSSVLYLAPNNFVISESRAAFFSYVRKNHGTRAFIPFQFLTLQQLAQGLYETHQDKRLISDRLRVLMLCEILQEKSIGYATILADLLKKTRHYIPDMNLAALKTEISSLIFDEKASARAVNAIDVLEKYEHALKKNNIIDPEAVMKESIDLIKNGGLRTSGADTASQLRGSGFTLAIDGFFDPSPLELEIINALISQADNVLVMAEEDTGIIKFLNQHRGGMQGKRLDRGISRESPGFYSYTSIEEEVEGIARNIKKRLLQGSKPWEITVSFPVLSKYLPMLRRVFYKYGIPASIGEYSLSSTRPLIALEGMITCIEEDYSRSDFLSILTSPHFPAIPAIVKERAVSCSYSAGVVKGKEAWLSIKETLLNAPRHDMSGDEREMLDEFQHAIQRTIKIFEDIKGKTDPGLFIDAFESALETFGFFDSLDNPASGINGERLLTKIRGRISEFRYFIGLIAESGQAIRTPASFLRYLLSSLKDSDEKRDGVKVIPFELAAGLETELLFLGGLLEGDFPSRPDIDPILPERVKKALGIPNLEYYLRRQKRYFKRLMHISRLDPYVTCPSADGDKIFLPSPFLNWEQKMLPPELNIFSEEEALLREGAIKRAGGEKNIFLGQGMFRSRETFGLLLKRIGMITKGGISVTDIDFYRKCPLRFYIEKILGFEIKMPPQFEVEARLWGSLAHKTMEYLFREGDVDPENFEKKILEGLDKGLKQFPIGEFWAAVAKKIFLTLLPAVREQEAEIRMQGLAPFEVEVKLSSELTNIKLKGKVDRVDIKAQRRTGTQAQSEQQGPDSTVILYDYKTGNIDSSSLQLPLYAAMWQNNFGTRVERLGYYSLKEGKVRWSPGEKVSMEEFIKTAVQSAEELAEKIQKGKFAPEPFKADECRFCHHKPLCSPPHPHPAPLPQGRGNSKGGDSFP